MQTKLNKQAQNLFNKSHLRRTGARTAVLNLLITARRPQTAEQIIARLGIKGPNKVTIYRTLESFVNAGFVHKAYIDTRQWHFELAHHCSQEQCHPHFICNNCGQTRCLTGQSAPAVKVPWKGFVVHRQQTKLEGLCPSCSTKRIKIS